MGKYIQVSTTTAQKSEAEKIADHLVRAKLAACAQVIGPIISHYIWKGKKEHAKEWLCLIKAKAISYKKIEKVITKLHSYEVPEIISMPINGGQKDYLNWIRKS